MIETVTIFFLNNLFISDQNDFLFKLYFIVVLLYFYYVIKCGNLINGHMGDKEVQKNQTKTKQQQQQQNCQLHKQDLNQSQSANSVSKKIYDYDTQHVLLKTTMKRNKNNPAHPWSCLLLQVSSSLLSSSAEGTVSGSAVKYPGQEGLYSSVGLSQTSEVASVRGEAWCPMALAWPCERFGRTAWPPRPLCPDPDRVWRCSWGPMFLWCKKSRPGSSGGLRSRCQPECVE